MLTSPSLRRYSMRHGDGNKWGKWMYFTVARFVTFTAFTFQSAPPPGGEWRLPEFLNLDTI